MEFKTERYSVAFIWFLSWQTAHGLSAVRGTVISKDWRITEFNIADMTWYSLNIKSVIESRPVDNPDLSKVDEIGFTDLMTGGGSDACSRLDWIEVYGKPVKR